MFNITIINKTLDLLFGKDSHDELAQKSVILGVLTSIFLVIIKFLAWRVTESISMQASMMDSLLDALASFVAYHALRFSAINYDVNHNYGHEKVEGVVALLQCSLIIYSGIMICLEAYEMFQNPSPITNSTIGVIVMGISCVAVYQLVYFQRYVATKTESMLVHGDSLHYLSDFLMNIGIMVSILLSSVYVYLDAICGILVGGYVLFNAAVIIRNALIDLMDEALPLTTQGKIKSIIMETPQVKSIKMLRTRSAGMKKYIEARVLMDPNMPLLEVDQISKKIERNLRKISEKTDVIIKVEAFD